MAYVYILFSEKDYRWYIGCTNRTINERYVDHCKGKVLSTKHRRPLGLAWLEECSTFSDARKREWFLKNTRGYKEKKAYNGSIADYKRHLATHRSSFTIRINGPVAQVVRAQDL